MPTKINNKNLFKTNNNDVQDNQSFTEDCKMISNAGDKISKEN